ncbi:hypothetical protein Tco_0678871 [Tanacetum coccineum]|uniref:Uncharacterized protein n=1 Tax=Tanacetum coccineum TaxID=301880 RepID=A0ABQ4XGF3_9ASTR
MIIYLLKKVAIAILLAMMRDILNKQAVEEEQNKPTVIGKNVLLKYYERFANSMDFNQNGRAIFRSHRLILIFTSRMASSVNSILLIQFYRELMKTILMKTYFDEEEGAIDNDILQIEDKILREKLLNVNLLIDKIEALNLIPSIPFVLENPSSSPIPVVDSEFLIEEVDTFLVPEDEYHLYERFTFDIEPDAPMINNFDKLNEDECFDPGGGEINVSQNVEDDDSFTFVFWTFLPYLTYHVDSHLLLSTGSEDTIFDPVIST